MNIILIYLGKLLSFLSKLANLGNGSTWPGHIALKVNKKFIENILEKSNTKIIIIAGTNGKTTTAKLIKSILEENKNSVFHNYSGANLLNGIASSLILESSFLGKLDREYAIFEVDENVLPLILDIVLPDYILCLNLFRDQLDRYGEVNSIAKNWKKSLNNLTPKTTLILNADDPAVSYLGKTTKVSVKYFGINDKNLAINDVQNAADSVYCLNCNLRLNYKEIYFSHLGNWLCLNCNNKRAKIDLDNSNVYPLKGTYNRYNTLASFLLAKSLGLSDKIILTALKKFKPAFGRQEIIKYKDKNVQIFLSKNPTSFNESLRTLNDMNGKNILFVLNDNIPDGQDISWIWDIDLENLIKNDQNITVSGKRAYDMGLRIKYSDIKNFKIDSNLKKAFLFAINNTKKSDTLYVFPTYSAMLDVRKILTGKKIL
ncbi:MAG TPA: Mur ligase family protein [Patescibacteria group bacterium]|nr:Mur ligase family protein [Patescibacteria group bacterium]